VSSLFFINLRQLIYWHLLDKTNGQVGFTKAEVRAMVEEILKGADD
jgi:hypothetical protein